MPVAASYSADIVGWRILYIPAHYYRGDRLRATVYSDSMLVCVTRGVFWVSVRVGDVVLM